MYKRTSFTSITPLPPPITRKAVAATLHSHREMIELNPLVTHCERCEPPPQAPADEHDWSWYEITDRISYLPGGWLQGNVSYKGGFKDRPDGIQTHVYAPMGLETRSTWIICGNTSSEPQRPGAGGWESGDPPSDGLFLREEVDMQCLVFASRFVKKTLEESHSLLVDRLVAKSDQSRPGGPGKSSR